MLIAIATASAYVCQAVLLYGNSGLKPCVSYQQTQYDNKIGPQAGLTELAY